MRRPFAACSIQINRYLFLLSIISIGCLRKILIEYLNFWTIKCINYYIINNAFCIIIFYLLYFFLCILLSIYIVALLNLLLFANMYIVIELIVSSKLSVTKNIVGFNRLNCFQFIDFLPKCPLDIYIQLNISILCGGFIYLY